MFITLRGLVKMYINYLKFPESFIVPNNAQHIDIKTLIFFTLKYITIAPTCFGFD
jgi:hypothetical protein